MLICDLILNNEMKERERKKGRKGRRKRESI